MKRYIGNFITRKNGELIFSYWRLVRRFPRKKRNGMRTAFVPRWLVTRDRFSNGFLAPILAWQNCIRKCILHIGSTTYNLPRLNVRHSVKKNKLGIFSFFVIYKFCNINSRRNRKKKKTGYVTIKRCNSISKFNNMTSRRKIIFYGLVKSVPVIQRAYVIFASKRECFFHITIEMIV